MQAIHDHVTVRAVPPADHRPQHGTSGKQKPRGSSSTSPVLQYVVENTGMHAVTFRVDFSGSHNIVLAHSRAISDATGDPILDGMAFECTVYPFERRGLVSVAKRSTRERAMIRVTYELLAEFEPDVAEITHMLEQNAENLRDLAITSHASYCFSHSHVQLGANGSCPSASWNQCSAADFCADVNQFFSLHGDLWLDPTFPVSRNPDDMELTEPTTDQGHHRLHSRRSIPLSMCAWRHLHSLIDDKSLWSIFRTTRTLESTKATRAEPGSSAIAESLERARSIPKIVSGLPAQHTFSCALAIIAADIGRWKCRWFSLCGISLSDVDSLEYLARNVVALPVRLCQGGVLWTAVVIDLVLPVFPLGNGLVAPRSVDGELWPALLHKAYAKLKGGYGAVAAASTLSILCDLLGVPCVLLHDLALASGRESKERALQRRLQQILSRKRQSPVPQTSRQPMLVITFAVETTPTIAPGTGFSILSYASTASSATDYVVLGDVDGMLHRTFGDRKLLFGPETSTEGRDAVVAIPWREFVDLQPSVWAFLPSVQHVRRVRNRFLWRHQGQDVNDDPKAVVVAISVATLSTVVLAGHLSAPATTADTDRCRLHRRSPARLQVCMCPADDLDELQALDTSDGISIKNPSSCRDIASVQVARTLTPGEYIVAIRVVDTSDNCDAEGVVCSCISRDIQENEDGKELSTTSAETNLVQLFECLDHEMQGILTARDLSTTLSLPGQGCAISPAQTAAIEGKFIARFGSPVDCHNHDDAEGGEDLTGEARAKVKRGLQLADLREVYRSLARGELGGSQSYQELVWHDLLALLGHASPMEEQEIRVDEIAALVCCVSSDSRLLDCVQLPVCSLAGFWPTPAG